MAEDPPLERQLHETSKNNSCQSAQTRTRKSPKMLKNLVIPSKEYYETPFEVTPPKLAGDLVSKESSHSAQTQQKDYSDFGPRKPDQASKSEVSVFNKSDICQTKHYFNEKSGLDPKKQVSFVKPKADAKPRAQFQSYAAKKPFPKTKETVFKSYVGKEPWKMAMAKPTVFKKHRGSEVSIPSSASHLTGTRVSGLDSIRGSRIFPKASPSDKKTVQLTSELAQLLLKDEEFLSGFLRAFHEDCGVADLFSRYLLWVDTADLERLLDRIPSPQNRNLFKVALIYERMAFYICYYIYARDSRKEEIIFLKKTTVHIYLNFVALTHELSLQTPEVS